MRIRQPHGGHSLKRPPRRHTSLFRPLKTRLCTGDAGHSEEHLRQRAHHKGRLRRVGLPRGRGARHRRPQNRLVPRPPGGCLQEMAQPVGPASIDTSCDSRLLPDCVLHSRAHIADAAEQVVPWGSTDALAAMQRRLGVDILVTGHTHQLQVGGQKHKHAVTPLPSPIIFSRSPARTARSDPSTVVTGMFRALETTGVSQGIRAGSCNAKLNFCSFRAAAAGISAVSLAARFCPMSAELRAQTCCKHAFHAV